MYTRDDLIDLLMAHLAPATPKARAASVKTGLPPVRGRLFFTEYDLKKRLTGGARRLTLPPGAIVSPLAADWLILNNVEIIRE